MPSAGQSPAPGAAVSPLSATERCEDVLPDPGRGSSPAAGERSSGWAGCGVLPGTHPRSTLRGA